MLAAVCCFEFKPALVAGVPVGWIMAVFIRAYSRAKKTLSTLDVSGIVVTGYFTATVFAHSGQFFNHGLLLACEGYIRLDEEFVNVISGKLVTKTDKALCIELKGKQEWFPMSQVSGLVIDGDNATFSVPDWLMRKKQQESVIEEASVAPIEEKLGKPVKLDVTQNWAICDACKCDAFNICKSGKLFFVQCSVCGKQLKLI